MKEKAKKRKLTMCNASKRSAQKLEDPDDGEHSAARKRAEKASEKRRKF